MTSPLPLYEYGDFGGALSADKVNADWSLEELLANAGLTSHMMTEGAFLYIYRHMTEHPGTDPTTGYLNTGGTFGWSTRFRPAIVSEDGNYTWLDQVYRGGVDWEDWQDWFLGTEAYGSMYCKSIRYYRSMYNWYDSHSSGQNARYRTSHVFAMEKVDLNEKLRYATCSPQFNTDEGSPEQYPPYDNFCTNHPWTYNDSHGPGWWKEGGLHTGISEDTDADAGDWGGFGSVYTTAYRYHYDWLKAAIRYRFKITEDVIAASSEFVDSQITALSAQSVFVQSAFNTKMQIVKPLNKASISALMEGDTSTIAQPAPTRDETETTTTTYSWYGD